MANNTITNLPKIKSTDVFISVEHGLPATDEPVLIELKKANGKLEYLVACYRNGAWREWDGFVYQLVHTTNRKIVNWISLPTQTRYWSEGTRM